jgi:hypothetical protein
MTSSKVCSKAGKSSMGEDPTMRSGVGDMMSVGELASSAIAAAMASADCQLHERGRTKETDAGEEGE